MDVMAVQTSYARWAPVYDKAFGALTDVGRRRAVEYINTRSGSVLEVGVGTGLSLEYYNPDMKVTGIDVSDDMLEKARTRVRDLNLGHVKGLRQMDARTLDFPDNHFDTVVAMHAVSVVPEPERVMAEMARVCKRGGKIVIINHFARDKGFMSFIESLTAPFSDLLGWHSDFGIEVILKQEGLTVAEKVTLPPFGMMTFLVLEKSGAAWKSRSNYS